MLMTTQYLHVSVNYKNLNFFSFFTRLYVVHSETKKLEENKKKKLKKQKTKISIITVADVSSHHKV